MVIMMIIRNEVVLTPLFCALPPQNPKVNSPLLVASAIPDLFSLPLGFNTISGILSMIYRVSHALTAFDL